MGCLSWVVLLVLTGVCAEAQMANPPQRAGFLETEFTPGVAVKLGLGLLYDQATVAVPEWGSRRAGLTRRAEWISAEWMARTSTEYAVASYRRVDIHYHPCMCRGFRRRAAHALESGFVEYRADGTRAFAVARFSGFASAAFATIPMLPASYSPRETVGRAAMAFTISEGFNVLQEFRGEIRRTLLPRSKPDKLRQ